MLIHNITTKERRLEHKIYSIWSICKTVRNSTFGFVRSGTFWLQNRYTNIRKEAAMYIIAAVIVILLIVLASADLFLSQFNADELSNMGVEKR